IKKCGPSDWPDQPQTSCTMEHAMRRYTRLVLESLEDRAVPATMLLGDITFVGPQPEPPTIVETLADQVKLPALQIPAVQNKIGSEILFPSLDVAKAAESANTVVQLGWQQANPDDPYKVGAISGNGFNLANPDDPYKVDANMSNAYANPDDPFLNET